MKSKTPSSISSAQIISDNDDLLLAILILLPAKSLLRFKSVTKRWRSLISDASFRHLHTRRHRRPETSFLLRVSPSQYFHLNPTSKTLVPFRFNFDEAIIRQSCNGLLLVQCESPHKEYYVYNPTTGESRNLFLPEYNFLGLFLVFDPWKSPHYKVFCMRFAKSLLVYDSETRSWNPDWRVYAMHSPLRDGVYSDNFIYSIMYDDNNLCFDIEKRTFGMPFSEAFDTEHPLTGFCIMESSGHVHCIAHDIAINHLVVDEMTANSGILSAQHLFDFDITPWCPQTTPWKISFLGIIRGHNRDDSLVFHIPGKIMAYRFYERSFEELLDCSAQGFYKDDRLQFTYHNSCQFVESLAPV